MNLKKFAEVLIDHKMLQIQLIIFFNKESYKFISGVHTNKFCKTELKGVGH